MSNIKWHLVILDIGLNVTREYIKASTLLENALQTQESTNPTQRNEWSSVSLYLSPKSHCVWTLTQRFRTHNSDYDNFPVYPCLSACSGLEYKHQVTPPGHNIARIMRWGKSDSSLQYSEQAHIEPPSNHHNICHAQSRPSFESQLCHQHSRRKWISWNNYRSCEQIFFWLCFLQVLNTQLFSWNWNMQIMDVDSL